MSTQEWSRIWHNAQVDVNFLQAFYVHHAYPRHSHDYYVICVVEQGQQSFTHKGTKYRTPAGGVILINPDVVHTGEAADEQGFQMRSLYPTTAHMQAALFELTGRHQPLPFFKEVRVDHPWARESILAVHNALTQGTDALECESYFTWTLVQLIKHYADLHYTEQRLGKEQKAIQQACRYIEERFDQGIRLSQLAEHVSLSPYYLLRVFRAEVGMPPYTYLESVRIRHAQRRIEAGQSLAMVAAEVGFSSQNYQAGLAAGVLFLMFLIGWVSSTILRIFPVLEPVLRYVGAAYILYLAFGILKASYRFTAQDVKPLGFGHGLMLQLLNPKLTVYAFTLFATFLAPITHHVVLLGLVAALLALISFVATSVWALFGSAIKRYLHIPRLKTGVNLLFSLSLVYAAIALIGLV